MSREAFCLTCGKHQPYRINYKIVEQTVREISFKYVEDTAVCSVCGNEVYVPEVNDRNVDRRERAYYEMERAGGRTCESCDKFLGCGDWGLCCSIKYDLVYADTPACESYGVKKNEP